jgi:pyruvate dehydrogenase E1 component alpha subunit
MSLKTAADLVAFEERIAALFNDGRIRAPIHLYSGNEEILIKIFEEIEPDDWVCCSWRSHYQCLLKGVPAEELERAILAGRSISLCFPEQRVISSGIVGGMMPIAVGLALEIKRRKGHERVWCFVGDMTAESGAFHECRSYAYRHDLPLNWVVEDNGKSVCTDTRSVWNVDLLTSEYYHPRTKHYKYTLTWPHAGAGKRVQF